MAGEPLTDAQVQAAVDEAVTNLREDIGIERLSTRAIRDLPLSQEHARIEQTDGLRALRASRPKTRRWRELDKVDDAVDKASSRHTEAGTRVQEAEEALRRAPGHDARTLADWLAGGERGKRPAATLHERERERDAARLLVEAAALELDRALERRLQHIEKHRPKMLGDARSDIDGARARLVAHVRVLTTLRQDLLDSRDALTWLAAYPEQPEAFGITTAAALGLRKPIQEHLHTTSLIEYGALLAVLEADAAALAEAFTDAQRAQLGTAQPSTPLSGAMWDSEVSKEWKKEQLERARAIAEWSPNPYQVADEAGDFRPDP